MGSAPAPHNQEVMGSNWGGEFHHIIKMTIPGTGGSRLNASLQRRTRRWRTCRLNPVRGRFKFHLGQFLKSLQGTVLDLFHLPSKPITTTLKDLIAVFSTFILEIKPRVPHLNLESTNSLAIKNSHPQEKALWQSRTTLLINLGKQTSVIKLNTSLKPS